MTRRKFHFLSPLRAAASVCVLGLGLAGSGLSASAQETDAQATQPVDFTRVWGPEDADLAVPKPSLPLGRKDPAALQAILDFLAAVNGAKWTGMQGTGTLTAPGEDGSSSAATLTVSNGDSFRLDVDAREGPRSIRIEGALGQIAESDGTRHILPLATARGGLVAFPKLMLNGFPSAAASVVDDAFASVDGETLRRVTVSEPVLSNQQATGLDQVSAVDLYFDPATHLLVKSAASVQIESKDRQRYVQVTTYGDYRQVGGMVLPFAYSQTLNGQRQWALELTALQLDPQVDSTYFTF